MPSLDVEDQDLESSPGSETLDVANTVESDGAASAKSSDAQDVADSHEHLNIVREVVDAKKGEVAAAASSAEVDDGSKAVEKPTKPDDENFSDAPFAKHPRFQQLLRKTKAYEVDAGRYQNVQRFMDDHGLAAEDAAEALQIAGLARTEPAKAWAMLKPFVQNLLIAVGEVLPDDLQQRVHGGELSRETAMEISRSRAQVASVERGRTFEQQRAERQQQVEVSNSIVGAADAWEADRRLKDPNFDAKLVPLQKEVAYLHATEGKPQDAEGVRDQLRRAYKAVNEQFQPAAPVAQRRQPIRPVTGGHRSDAPAKPVFQNTLDIVRAHANRAAAG